MAHHHRVPVHWTSDHRMVHDPLPRHFRLLRRFRLVHHWLRRVGSLHRSLCHHRLHALLLAALLLLLLVVLRIVLVAALLQVALLAVVAVLLLRLRLVADLGGRVDDRVGSRLVLKVVLVVHAQIHKYSI